jgi:alkylation response protein AidB-like acyl-CoA dehydrogenase
MTFFQTPPSLGNQYTQDRALQSLLAHSLPDEVRRAIEPTLAEMGELAGGELARTFAEDRASEPRLVQWDAWGHRIDRIEVTATWKLAARVAVEKGLIATAYERRHGEHSRVHQFALVYLFDPSTGVYTCPLAMTDGAAKTLVVSKNGPLLERALPRLTSRDPSRAWTSGQWMTERTGGSDVAISETVARRDVEGTDLAGLGDLYRLHGTKWFTSATTSDMALTLGRPEGNPPGGSGLALYYVELRDEAGRMNRILVNRLKDKLGTRMVPTAELTLDGTPAVLVCGPADGIKNITPMLNITRAWNAVGAISGMRRGLALARDYAKKRVAFGAPLAEKALHVDTLAGLEAEFEGALHLTFRMIALLGKEEAGTLREEEQKLLRLLTPIVKATTAKQAVAVASEVLEAFGGAGYVEDTGLPRILRDSQVLPIWEGTTNVLSLDVLRVLGRGASLDVVEREIRARVETASDAGLTAAGRVALDAVAHAHAWLAGALKEGPAALEAGARRFALTLGRALELALLVEHGSWSLAAEKDGRGAAAAKRFARHGVDLVVDGVDAREARALANDEAV